MSKLFIVFTAALQIYCGFWHAIKFWRIPLSRLDTCQVGMSVFVSSKKLNTSEGRLALNEHIQPHLTYQAGDQYLWRNLGGVT
jgi:hypothetical protein